MQSDFCFVTFALFFFYSTPMTSLFVVATVVQLKTLPKILIFQTIQLYNYHLVLSYPKTLILSISRLNSFSFERKILIIFSLVVESEE